MENGTEEIFKEQLKKLPSEVVSFISSSTWEEDLDEIGSMYNLSKEELSSFVREATLVVVGLVHPDAFATMLEQEVGIKGAVLEALVLNVEKKIFAPIRPALVEFFNSETAIENEGGGASLDSVTVRNEAVQDLNTGDSVQDVNLLIQPRRSTDSQRQEPPVPPVPLVSNVPPVPRMPDVAPDNLPTVDELELFLPPLISKAPNLDVGFPSEGGALAHPFEEKMKKVFIAGQQSMGDLTIEAPTAQMGGTEPLPTLQQAPNPDRPHPVDPYREAIE